jgi:hypothetical protein
MLKMTLRATLPPSYYVYTLLEKCPEVLLRATLILVPLLFDKSLEFCKELFDWVEVGGIRRQIQQLDASLTAHLFNSLTVSRQKYPNAALWPPRQHDHPKLHKAVNIATHVQIEYFLVFWCRIDSVFGLPASSFSASPQAPWHAHNKSLDEATWDAPPT